MLFYSDYHRLRFQIPFKRGITLFTVKWNFQTYAQFTKFGGLSFSALIPEGDFRSRHKAIHALPGAQLCEAVLPINKLERFFIPMTKPIGVVRKKNNIFPAAK